MLKFYGKQKPPNFKLFSLTKTRSRSQNRTHSLIWSIIFNKFNVDYQASSQRFTAVVVGTEVRRQPSILFVSVLLRASPNHSHNLIVRFHHLSCQIRFWLCSRSGDIAPKRATRSGIRFRDSAPGWHISKETSQRWQLCVWFNRPRNRTTDLPHP